MGRRKIDIKPIKDDRNRSVTFLKRKGGLFKKAHELSVLCNVEVAVIIFGTNKKVHEYASGDIRDLITRYYHHTGPIEHRGPSDFKAGATDSDEEDAPDVGAGDHSDGPEPSMLPQHFQGPPFAHMRQHTPSASPPIPSGAFLGPHGLPMQRAHTPQPHMGSRPSSRNDIRRMGPNMGGPGPAPQAVNGFAFMPQPAIYNPNAQNQQQQGNMPPHGMQPQGPQFPYPPPQAHTHQMQAYMDDHRRSSLPPNFPPQQGPPQIQRHSVSPPPVQMPPQQQMHQMSPPPPHLHPMQSPPLSQHQQQMRYQQQEQQQQHEHQQMQQQAQQQQQQQQQQHQQQQQQEQRQVPQVQIHEPLAPPPEAKQEVKQEPSNTTIRKPPLLDTGFNIKRLPQRKGGSIFTPIDENRSILAQHLSAFHPSSNPSKSDSDNNKNGEASRNNSRVTSSPPQLSKLNTQFNAKQDEPAAAAPEGPTFTVPSRTSSMMTSAGSRPRLKVRIPEGASETGGSTAAETSSPRNPSTDTLSQNSNSRPGGSIVLPPPSPSASAILSAGATGPVNPFARPLAQQHQSMHIDTPVSALPSRVMNGDFLPSPSSFFPDWNHSNTLPSPLNFATPLVTNGPSFLREDPSHKRKSPEGDHGHGADPKRVKIDT